MIHGPEHNRERIMLYGAAGTGKSRAYLDIYDNTDAHFWVIDTDVAVERMFHDRDTSRITFTEATDYESAANAFIQAGKRSKPGDWVVIDMLTPCWQWCQDYWVTKSQKGVTADSLAVWMPTSKLDYDWVSINRMYNAFMANVMKSQGHILAICEEDDIGTGKWENETDRAFATLEKKPKGNKRNPHLFHSVLHCTRLSLSEPIYRMTSAKEREGRECDWIKHDMTDLSFVDEYLVALGGWEKDAPKRKKRR